MRNLTGSKINESLKTLENFVGKFSLWRGLFRKHLDYDNDSVSVYLVKNNPALVVTSLFRRFNGERKTNYDSIDKLSAVLEDDCLNAYAIGRNIRSLTNLQPKLKHRPVHYNNMATIYNNHVEKLNDFVEESSRSIVYSSKGNFRFVVSVDRLIHQLDSLIQADECNAYGREILARYKSDLVKFLPRGFWDDSRVLTVGSLSNDDDFDDESSSYLSSLETISTPSRSEISSETSGEAREVRIVQLEDFGRKFSNEDMMKRWIADSSSEDDGEKVEEDESGKENSADDSKSETSRKRKQNDEEEEEAKRSKRSDSGSSEESDGRDSDSRTSSESKDSKTEEKTGSYDKKAEKGAEECEKSSEKSESN